LDLPLWSPSELQLSEELLMLLENPLMNVVPSILTNTDPFTEMLPLSQNKVVVLLFLLPVSK
jgi:hypothetical protein